MPAGDLTAYAGFHGKLPAAGDFVARGLPEAFVPLWDRWIARHIAPLDLPAEGLRLSLVSGGRSVAGVILPSADRHGRRFPLSLLQISAVRPEPAEVDRWAGEVLAFAGFGPDALAEALDAARPMAGGGPVTGPLSVWTRGGAPQEAPLDAPGPALSAALSSR